MRSSFWLAAASILVGSSTAQVLDLGQLGQYDPKTVKTDVPQALDQNGLWVSEVDGGYSLVPGKDISEKLQKALKSCQQFDAACYDELTKATSGMHVQTDPKLEARQLGALAILGAAAAAFVSVAGAHLHNSKPAEAVVQGVFVPGDQVDSFTALTPGATVTISGEGTAIATVTQPAEETKVQASATPTVSIVTSASDGFEKGDLDIQLDAELATRLNEYIQRVKEGDCKDGEGFAKAAAVKRGDGFAITGQVVCTTERVVQGVAPGAVWQDILLIDASKVHIDLSGSVQKGKEALSVLADFVQAYAPLMTVDETVGEQLAIAVLLMVYDAIVENVPIGTHNRVKAGMVEINDEGSETETETTATESSGCPQPTSLLCGAEGEDCPLEFKTKAGKKGAFCKKGEHKDCKCTTVGFEYPNVFSPERQKLLTSMIEALKAAKNTSEDKAPECDIKTTAFQSSLFYSEQGNVVEEFCKQWKKEEGTEMTVNAKGEEQKPVLRKRTPPPNADAMTSWRVDLRYTKSDQGGQCSSDCKKAYETMSKKCTSNSIGSYIYEEGSYDVGCGTFEYKVYNTDADKPSEEPEAPADDADKPEPFEPKIDCGGSGICSGPLLKVMHCDRSVNTLQRGEGEDAYWYTTDKSAEPKRKNGNCWANRSRNGCGTFLEGNGDGNGCSVTGGTMWQYYQKIRDQCSKCGKIEFSPGCFFKIDYIYSCDNHL